MESIQNIDNAGLPLEEPHFDDELTVVTAQPVVSLEVIAEARRHRRRWFLAGAFALALFLGAVTALVAISIKRQMAESSAVQSAVSDDEAPAALDVSQIQGGETSALATSIEEDPSEPEVVPAPPAYREQNRPKKEPQRAVTKSPLARKPIVVQEEEQKPVLVDQWEERRVRRVWRRDRKERRQKEELFRIGEIFEGRSRPN